MNPTNKFVPYLLFFSGFILLVFLAMQPLTILKYKEQIAILFPKGFIGIEQRNLLLIIQGLMLLVVIPVYVLTFIFSWKYSSQNPKGKYDPDLVDNNLAEYIWWGVPLILTAVISVLTWIKTEQLDPFKPIESDKKTLTIQAVALQWKWLFIYPEENIAIVNYLQFPKNVPLRFEITADAPMNSFWIPALGGQIYAMPKMKTQLNLIANEIGEFRGSSANLSGEGFAGMHFIAKASSEEDYENWLKSIKQSRQTLDNLEYEKLAKPTKNHAIEFYKLDNQKLFEKILMKYMHPSENNQEN